MTVSAIIPCFNAETTIERAIVSVVSQTIPVFEIIVVNDGSTDNSGRLLEELKFKKIKGCLMLEILP
jgi:glycosyltransferase involved in cell wall biosynthesis